MSLAEDDQYGRDLPDAHVPYPNPFAGPNPNDVSILEFIEMMRAGVDPVEHENDLRQYFEESVEPGVLEDFFRTHPYGFMPMPTSQLVSAPQPAPMPATYAASQPAPMPATYAAPQPAPMPATYAASQPGPSSTTASNPAGGDDGNDDAINLWESDDESQPGPADFAHASQRQYPTPFDGTAQYQNAPQPEVLLGMRPAGNLNVYPYPFNGQPLQGPTGHSVPGTFPPPAEVVSSENVSAEGNGGRRRPGRPPKTPMAVPQTPPRSEADANSFRAGFQNRAQNNQQNTGPTATSMSGQLLRLGDKVRKMVGAGQGLLIGKIIHIRGNDIKVETILDTVNANRRSQNRAYVSNAKNWEKLTNEEFNQAVADYRAQHMNQQNAPVYYYPRVMPAHMHPLVYVSMRPYH